MSFVGIIGKMTIGTASPRFSLGIRSDIIDSSRWKFPLQVFGKPCIARRVREAESAFAHTGYGITKASPFLAGRQPFGLKEKFQMIEHDWIDRAKHIRERLIQLRDSL